MEALVLKFIEKSGKYCTAREISEEMGVSLFSLYSSGVSIVDLNKRLGFTKKTVTRESIVQAVGEFIKSQPGFVPATLVAKVLHISRATLNSYNISVDELNEEYGKTRPGAKPSNQHNLLTEEFKASKRDEIRNFLKAEGYSPLNSVLKKFGFPSHWRTWLDYDGIVEELVLENNGVKRLGSQESLREKIVEIIRLENRYCTSDYLAKKIGVAPSTFAFRNINTESLNIELGFVRKNKFFESEVGKALQEIFPNHITAQANFPTLVSRSNCRLYFDFYIEDLRLAVEADGPCHYDKGHPWFSASVVERDALKETFCKNNNITLVRIPFTGLVTVDYVKSFITGSPLEPTELQHDQK